MSDYIETHGYRSVRDLLLSRLEERAPAKIQLLAGPRQVGKTTLLSEIADQWEGRAIYASADAPEAEPWEVDGVLQGDWGRWIVEVKTGRYSAADLKGLAVASTKFPDFSPVVVCDPGEESPAEAAGFRAIPWPDYLLGGL